MSMWRAFLVAVLLAAIAVTVPPRPRVAEAAVVVPTGFSDTEVIRGRTNPTAMAFAPNGDLFVTEKSGKVWRYKGLTDTAPNLVADIGSTVQDYWDRGLLGVAVPPNYPTDNSLYILYTYDATIYGTPGRWGDNCPTPPGPTTDGCVVSGRLSRLTLDANAVATREDVLINDWCQQFPSHSIGMVAFGPDGYLYVSGGDGAAFHTIDFGQLGATYAGDQANPCGDPPGAAGVALSSPAAQGGSLRSQSVRRPSGPVVLGGTVVRVSPSDGYGVPGNPFYLDPSANKARIVAYGMRNPFRFTFRPGTSEIWLGDVGAGDWEEVNRIANASDSTVDNFGWPCFEGSGRQPAFDAANLDSCETLYNAGGVTAPYYTYNHSAAVVPNDGCLMSNGSSITGTAFYSGGSYPAAYNGALFFADHTRQCIWAMQAGANGLPDPTKIVTIVKVTTPVDLKVGPNGDIFYADMDGGSIHRITATTANQPPVARLSATPTAGPTPLNVQFDGTASTDPEHSALTYQWDFGDHTTGTGPNPVHTYQTNGQYTASLVVVDAGGLSSASATGVINAGSSALTATMTVTVTNPAGLTVSGAAVGDTVRFSGAATGSTGQPLPSSAYRWQLIIYHLEHTHNMSEASGITSGSFFAPDHSYPSYLSVLLTVTDPSTGQTTSVSRRVDYRTVPVTIRTNPGGLRVSLGADLGATVSPFTVTVIVGHQMTVSAPATQTAKSGTFNFQSWSDGGAATHTLTAPSSAAVYTATYRKK